MKRVYQLPDEEDEEGDQGRPPLPAAEMVAFEGDADEAGPVGAPGPPGQGQGQLENRVGYTVKDNKQYYELASMFVVVYQHVKEGRPVSSLFLPNESTTPEFDF